MSYKKSAILASVMVTLTAGAITLAQSMALGATNAPDLIGVGDFNTIVNNTNDSVTEVSFEFDQDVFTSTQNGFSLIPTDGSDAVSSIDSVQGSDRSTLTVQFDGELIKTDYARVGVAGDSVSSEDEGAGSFNHSQVATIGDGNTANPDLVSVKYQGNGEFLLEFDQDLTSDDVVQNNGGLQIYFEDTSIDPIGATSVEIPEPDNRKLVVAKYGSDLLPADKSFTDVVGLIVTNGSVQAADGGGNDGASLLDETRNISIQDENENGTPDGEENPTDGGVTTGPDLVSLGTVSDDGSKTIVEFTFDGDVIRNEGNTNFAVVTTDGGIIYTSDISTEAGTTLTATFDAVIAQEDIVRGYVQSNAVSSSLDGTQNTQSITTIEGRTSAAPDLESVAPYESDEDGNVSYIVTYDQELDTDQAPKADAFTLVFNDRTGVQATQAVFFVEGLSIADSGATAGIPDCLQDGDTDGCNGQVATGTSASGSTQVLVTFAPVDGRSYDDAILLNTGPAAVFGLNDGSKNSKFDGVLVEQGMFTQVDSTNQGQDDTSNDSNSGTGSTMGSGSSDVNQGGGNGGDMNSNGGTSSSGTGNFVSTQGGVTVGPDVVSIDGPNPTMGTSVESGGNKNAVSITYTFDGDISVRKNDDDSFDYSTFFVITNDGTTAIQGMKPTGGAETDNDTTVTVMFELDDGIDADDIVRTYIQSNTVSSSNDITGNAPIAINIGDGNTTAPDVTTINQIQAESGSISYEIVFDSTIDTDQDFDTENFQLVFNSTRTQSAASVTTKNQGTVTNSQGQSQSTPQCLQDGDTDGCDQETREEFQSQVDSGSVQAEMIDTLIVIFSEDDLQFEDTFDSVVGLSLRPGAVTSSSDDTLVSKFDGSNDITPLDSQDDNTDSQDNDDDDNSDTNVNRGSGGRSSSISSASTSQSRLLTTGPDDMDDEDDDDDRDYIYRSNNTTDDIDDDIDEDDRRVYVVGDNRVMGDMISDDDLDMLREEYRMMDLTDMQSTLLTSRQINTIQQVIDRVVRRDNGELALRRVLYKIDQRKDMIEDMRLLEIMMIIEMMIVRAL